MTVLKLIGSLIVGCLLILAVLCGVIWLSAAAHAHKPYSDLKDPVTDQACCGGSDCAVLKVEPGMLDATIAGYVVTLTGPQAQAINPARTQAVTFIVPWSRVQQSWDGNFHVCIAPNPYMGWEHPDKFYCFWAPPNT